MTQDEEILEEIATLIDKLNDMVDHKPNIYYTQLVATTEQYMPDDFMSGILVGLLIALDIILVVHF